ncbi:MAG: hypothetical protein HGA54_02815 [Actinobacteria bacterium]|nr:hypothetical protein [Actinomycetota bacterium]
MSHYEDIYEQAADNYGVITAAEAKDLGISDKEMSRLAKQGLLQRIGYGVYRLTHHPPTEYDRYAQAVALVGPEAVLYGETVLAMHNLALVNPGSIMVSTPKRIRRRLPAWVTVLNDPVKEKSTYEGIPSQTIMQAILSCRGRVINSRLQDAVRDAREQGLITKFDADILSEELSR